MFVFENPVLQREMVVNLRMHRAFLLLLVYQLVLAAVVYFAWPTQLRLDANADQARDLVNMFFLGQYILASLMAPSFAAGSITGEKERKTYEMLLASPLLPSAICFGKLMTSLAHLALLIFASLPIVMLCLPLGGVSIYEVLAAYLGLILSVATTVSPCTKTPNSAATVLSTSESRGNPSSFSSSNCFCRSTGSALTPTIVAPCSANSERRSRKCFDSSVQPGVMAFT